MKCYVLKKTIREEIFSIEVESSEKVQDIIETVDISKYGTRISEDEDVKIEWWVDNETIDN